MQISIIIPAYNAAKYLNRCIESVANQDLPHDCYEVIVVNDGSTDNTIDILNLLCCKYSCLKYVSTPNGGLSRARNRGIVEASGEYLLFLDSDDSFAPNVLGTIYEEMSEYQLDVMLLDYVHISFNGTLLDTPYRINQNSREVVSGRDFLLADCYPPMVWVYAYRRAFLSENALKMIPIWHEDEEFTPRSIYFAQRIKYVPLTFYNYYQNSDSYTNQTSESHALNIIAAMESLYRFSVTFCTEKRVNEYFDDHIAVILMRLFKQSIRQGYQNQNCIIEKVKEAGLLPLKPRKSSFYYCLFNISPLLFTMYYKAIKGKYMKKG